VAVARVTKPPDVGKNVTRTDIPSPAQRPGHAERTANAGIERRHV
jgi:hypothetical protein